MAGQELRFSRSMQNAVCARTWPARFKNLNVEELIDRKLMRFMAKGHAYAWLAMQEAIADAALPEDLVSNVRTGLIVGAGGASHESILEGIDTLRERACVA